MYVLGRTHPLFIEEATHIGGVSIPVVVALFAERVTFGVLAELQLSGRSPVIVIVIRQLERSGGLVRGGAYAEEQVEELVKGLQVFLILHQIGRASCRERV